MSFFISAIAASTLLAPIKNTKPADVWTDNSYTCHYKKAKAPDKENALFISGTNDGKYDEKFALINFAGKDIILNLVSKKDGKVKSVRHYKNGKLSLTAEFIVTSPCDVKTGCEADTRDLKLTVTKGKRKQSLLLEGYCAI